MLELPVSEAGVALGLRGAGLSGGASLAKTWYHLAGVFDLSLWGLQLGVCLVGTF